MKNKLIVGVAFLFFGAFVFYLASRMAAHPKERFSSVPAVPGVFDCKTLHDQLEKELDDANTCEKDSDCKVVSLGGQYTELGCYKFVHKGVNQIKLYEKVERYYNSCYEKIDKCEPLTKPVCVNNKCEVPSAEN